MKKIAFIIRGNLKNPGQFRERVSTLFNPEFDATIKFTRTKGHAINIVYDLLQKGVDYIVAVGGDGTLNEVINGCMQATPEQRAAVVLAVYPRGAGNDFTRTTGRFNSLQQLHKAIHQPKIKKIDLIKARFFQNTEALVRYYDNSFDIGIGGVVCQHVNRSNKTFGSTLTYLLNTMWAFLTIRRISVKLTAPGFSFEGRVLELVVNNGRYYGSGLCITPDARIDDGLANVVIARNVNLLQFLWFIPRLKRGQKIEHPEVFYHTLSECLIESANAEVPMEFDGEVLGSLPLTLKVIPGAVKLLIP